MNDLLKRLKENCKAPALGEYDGVYFIGDDRLLVDDVRAVIEKIELAQSKLYAIQEFINSQAADEGLWGESEYASEAYIQYGLRACHAFIESVIKDGPRPETTKNND